MLGLFIASFLVALAYMTLWFVVGMMRGRSDVADVAWGGTFIAIALTSFLLGQQSPTSYMVSLLVLIWGTRLSIHIYARNRRKKEDARYKELKQKWGKVTPLKIYLRIFFVQAVLATLVSFPVIIVNGSDFAVGLLQMAGLVVWVIGFSFEVIGDAQLKRFLKLRSAPEAVLSTGLWRYSRHPNYFGEVTSWWGIWMICLTAPYGWLGVVGPLTITVLILFISGVPLLENRYKNNKAYRQYAQRTSKFIPRPPRN